MDRVPEVTPDDVVRVIRRDFPDSEQPEVVAALNEYGPASPLSEPDRVHLAILKLGGGDLDELRKFVEIAKRDYREVICPAEYPQSLIALASGRRPDFIQTSGLAAADWQQYEAWLQSEEPQGGERDLIVANSDAPAFQGDTSRARRMPGWAAPLVGTLLGMALALSAELDADNKVPLWAGLCAGAGLGFVAGMLIWLSERRKR